MRKRAFLAGRIILKCILYRETLEALKVLIEQSKYYGEPVIPSELRQVNDRVAFGITCTW